MKLNTSSSLYFLLHWSIVLAAVISVTEGLECYFCTVKKPSRRLNVTAKLCSKFDGSDKYVVDCPLSTFCETKTFRLQTHTETVSVVTRGCAKQDYSYQQLVRGRWRQKTVVSSEAYSDGCINSVPYEGQSVNKEYCFCSNDLCNHPDYNSGTLWECGPFYLYLIGAAVLVGYCR